MIVAVFFPAAAVVALLVYLEVRRRRAPSLEKQMGRAFERHAKNCRRGLHEWSTPWVSVGVTAIYASHASRADTAVDLPIRREERFMTTCRHCGRPTSKAIEK